MPEALAPGLGLITLGGMLLGSFTLPMKFTPRWPWEATWLIYSVSGLLLFPIAVAVATLPPLSTIYLHASPASLAAAALFGMGWGVGSVLFGIGIDRLGMSLGFSIILGLTAALGSLVPMLVLAPAEIVTPRGVVLLGGLGVIIIGIYLCGVASGVKERAVLPAGSTSGSATRTGLIICILAGILASMLNLAMAFGQDIAQRAMELDVSAANATNAIWVLAVACGAIANVGYCVWLLIRNGSASAFRVQDSASHWVLGIVMGALWFSGINLYGRGAAALGSWGAVLGWPLLMAMMIVTANALGWLTGEWAEAPGRAQRIMLGGIAVLGAGVFVTGYSGTL